MIGEFIAALVRGWQVKTVRVQAYRHTMWCVGRYGEKQCNCGAEDR